MPLHRRGVYGQGLGYFNIICLCASMFPLSVYAQLTPAIQDHTRLSNPSRHNTIFAAVFNAEFAISRQQPEYGLATYLNLIKQFASPVINERALNVALQQQDYDSALAITQRWNVAYPDDVPAMFYLAHLALRTHHYDLAADTLDRIIAIDSNADLEGILQGIYPESNIEREALQRALTHSRNLQHPSILVILAGLEAQQGHYRQALLKVNRALQRRPHTASFVILKANLYLASGRTAAALAWLEQSSSRQRTPDVGLFEIEQLLKLHRPHQALNKIHRLLNTWPKHPQLLFLAANTYYQKQQLHQAELYFKALQNHDAYRDQAYFYLAKIAEHFGQTQQAINHYKNVDGNLYSLSRKNLVALYLKQQLSFEAIRFLTQERVSHPQQASFLYQLQVQILQTIQQPKRAIELLDEAIKQLPDDVELLYAQVLLLDPQRDQQRLDHALTRLLELEPNNPTFLNAYAYILAQQQRNLELARKYAEQALSYAPEQASILDTLGYIEYLQHDDIKAVLHLRDAYQHSPNAGIAFRYAQALLQANDQDRYSTLYAELQYKFPQDNTIKTLPHPKALHTTQDTP